MADLKLEFHLKLNDGREMSQSLSVPADGNGKETPTPEQVVMQMLQQYAAVGMLKRDGKKFILVTCGMIDTVEVEIPSVLVANTNEIKQTSKIIL